MVVEKSYFHAGKEYDCPFISVMKVNTVVLRSSCLCDMAAIFYGKISY
ncbi:MAG: hypothetical protein PHY44_03645 [Lachnospiraceae bacterium]|nr:hypothetical protein [Lachnospiraceae bacterium]